MPTENVSIPTSRGYELAGTIEMPTGLVRGAALFAHCFTCTRQSRGAVAISKELARQGIATLRFDFAGLGGSGGDFGSAGFAGDVEDLVEAARYMCDRFGDGILLVGHSLGGAAVLAAADDIGVHRIAAIATAGAPADVPHVLGNIDGDLDAIERDGDGDVTIAGRPFHLSKKFLDRTRSIDLLDEVSRLRIPLLFAHAPTDATVDISNAERLFVAAKHPKSFISLAGADHLLTKQDDADFIARVISSWARRYLPLRENWPRPELGVVVCTGHGKFGTEVHTKSHSFIADEPKSYGGDDTGPTPYDLLLAALGTCSAMTMKLYADSKRWPFEGVHIDLVHEKDHADDCTDCVEGKFDLKQQALVKTITLHGEGLSQEQREKILAIAEKCPVHQTLEGHLRVVTKFAD